MILGLKIVLPENVKDRTETLRNLSWVLRCFMNAIDDAYVPFSTRREEAHTLVFKTLTDLKPELTPGEFEELSHGLLNNDHTDTSTRYG